MKDYSNIKIGWTGEVLAIRGYATTARRLLKPLIEAGADVKLMPFEPYITPENKIDDPFWLEQIEKSKNKPAAPVHINYCLPTLFKPEQGSINVLNSQWETDTYPREWVPIINSANAFWVGTPSLIESAKRADIKVPLDCVNATIDLSEWTPEGEVTNITEIPENTVKFMFVGDWIPRKNYEDLIIGYMTAFSGHKDVALIIKTWSNQPGAGGKRHIEEAIKHISNKLNGIDRPKIYLVTDMMEEKRLISLMRGTDVYVTVSHGEGFDLPMVQAMALGKLVVGTDFLAHKDYMTVDNSIPVKYTMKPCYGAVAPLYDAYQMWSTPDMSDYISKLRVAYQLVTTDRSKDIGIKARETVNNLFSPEANTPKFVEAIERVMSLRSK